MKFIHLGDLHIGKYLGDFDLIEDQIYILNQILHIAEEHDVDAVLMSGDIYDKAIPREAAVRVFNEFICKLVQEGIKTFVISGNHDSDERLNFGSSLFEANQVYISAKYEGVLKKITTEDEYGKINIYMMPFIKASQVRHFYPEEEITNYDQAVRIAIEKSQVNPDERNVLMAHQFVVGKGSEPEFGGSENFQVQNVGTIEKIGADCFEAFDYVALGHIHSAQKIDRETIRYSGSVLKYSLSEANKSKSVPVVSVGEKGQVDVELVKLRPLRDLRHIRGKMAQLLDKKNIQAQDDFIYATLTDEEVMNDAMGIFQQIYPNTVRIDYDNSHTKEIQQFDFSKVVEKKSFSDLIREFYTMMYQCEISDEELKLMKEVAREAGVSDETEEISD